MGLGLGARGPHTLNIASILLTVSALSMPSLVSPADSSTVTSSCDVQNSAACGREWCSARRSRSRRSQCKASPKACSKSAGCYGHYNHRQSTDLKSLFEESEDEFALLVHSRRVEPGTSHITSHHLPTVASETYPTDPSLLAHCSQ